MYAHCRRSGALLASFGSDGWPTARRASQLNPLWGEAVNGNGDAIGDGTTGGGSDAGRRSSDGCAAETLMRQRAGAGLLDDVSVPFTGVW